MVTIYLFPALESDPVGDVPFRNARGHKMTYRRPMLVVPTVLTLLFLLVPTKNAHAYIDPGSGSFLWQVAIAFLVSAAVSVRMFWRHIKSVLAGWFSKSPKPDDNDV